MTGTYGVKFSQRRAWGLSVITCGVWAVWWLHGTRRRFDAELGNGRDDALKHSLLYFVPIANYFVIYWLWRDLDALRQRVGLPPMPVLGYVLGAVLLAPVFFTIVLNRYNEYWDVRLEGRAMRAPVTTSEKVAIAVGVVVFLLYMVLIALLLAAFAIWASTN
jgi:hypothetical protein